MNRLRFERILDKLAHIIPHHHQMNASGASWRITGEKVSEILFLVLSIGKMLFQLIDELSSKRPKNTKQDNTHKLFLLPLMVPQLHLELIKRKASNGFEGP